MKTAGTVRLGNRLITRAPRMGRRLAAEITQALSAQTAVVVGTNANTVLPHLAGHLAALRRKRDEISVEEEKLVEAHPLQLALISMPRVGIRTAARLLTDVSGKHCATAGHLASYAGLAPVTRRSTSSIRGEHSSQRGNKALKRALFLSAFAALHDQASQTYYDRKNAQGKRHNQALLGPARRRCNVPYAMMRDSTLYENEPKKHDLAA